MCSEGHVPESWFPEMATLARQNRVVVTGLGVLAANGIGKAAFWDSLLHGRSGIGPITLFDTSKMPCKIAGEVRDFDPSFYIDRRLKPQRMSRCTQLALSATQMAITDAGLDIDRLRLVRDLPLVLGVSSSAVDVLENHARMVAKKGADHGLPHSTYAFMPHAPANTIAYALGLQAQPVTLSTACAAGLDAVATAYGLVRSGKTDIALAGGADAPITYLCFASFVAAGLVSTREQPPEKASRPFDLDRDCGVIAEGAAVVVLENLDHALARGARPYLAISGCSMNMDADPTQPGCGLAGTMTGALQNAGCTPRDIDYVCAHGPGHPVIDTLETEAIKRALGDRAYCIPVTSIKGSTGNALAASGPQQLVACSLVFREGKVPPTTNYKKPDPACDLDYVAAKPRTARPACAVINSHGLGGRNCSIVVQRTQEP